MNARLPVCLGTFPYCFLFALPPSLSRSFLLLSSLPHSFPPLLLLSLLPHLLIHLSLLLSLLPSSLISFFLSLSTPTSSFLFFFITTFLLLLLMSFFFPQKITSATPCTIL